MVVLDCSDLEQAAEFWTSVLGDDVREGEADGTYQALVPADGVGVELLLQSVPRRRNAKNRVHLDLRSRDLTAEVARVLALGAAQITPEPLAEDGWTWHILAADPDGNELCGIQPDPQYWETH